MKIVIQRVLSSSVKVGGETVGEIGRGLLVLLGISNSDTKEKAEKAVAKISRLRIFPDENGKTNLSIGDIGGELLVVSQFTLFADCRRGNRPGFTEAGAPQFANELYEYFIEYSKKFFPKTEHGIFGADMEVSLINDGPFTVILEDGNGL